MEKVKVETENEVTKKENVAFLELAKLQGKVIEIE